MPDEQIRNGLEQIYNAKGNGYEEAVAMTGALTVFCQSLCTIMKGKIRKEMQSFCM